MQFCLRISRPRSWRVVTIHFIEERNELAESVRFRIPVRPAGALDDKNFDREIPQATSGGPNGSGPVPVDASVPDPDPGILAFSSVRPGYGSIGSEPDHLAPGEGAFRSYQSHSEGGATGYR